MDINLQKNWWIVNVAAGVVGILAVILAEQFFPSLEPYALIVFLVLVGLSFLCVFNNKKEMFWAVAPGVGALGFAVAGIVSMFIPENNGWVATLILGVTAFVIAAIPNPRADMKFVYLIGALILVIGFLMAPVSLLWKIIGSVFSVLIAGYLLWRDRESLKRYVKT